MIAPGWVEDLAWLVVWNVRYCAQGGSEVEMQIVGKRDSSGRGARALLQLPAMAAAQLRKTFKYPSEYSDDDDLPGDLDEEGDWRLYCQEWPELITSI